LALARKRFQDFFLTSWILVDWRYEFLAAFISA
jgi:hypothetical protein